MRKIIEPVSANQLEEWRDTFRRLADEFDLENASHCVHFIQAFLDDPLILKEWEYLNTKESQRMFFGALIDTLNEDIATSSHLGQFVLDELSAQRDYFQWRSPQNPAT